MLSRLARAILSIAIVSISGAACDSAATASTSPTTVTSPATSTLASLLYPTGSVFQMVSVAQVGTMSLTLASTSPPGVEIGVGIGVPSGSSCMLTLATRTVATGAVVLSTDVDPGSYCAGVFGLNAAEGQPVSFDLRITHP